MNRLLMASCLVMAGACEASPADEMAPGALLWRTDVPELATAYLGAQLGTTEADVVLVGERAEGDSTAVIALRELETGDPGLLRSITGAPSPPQPVAMAIDDTEVLVAAFVSGQDAPASWLLRYELGETSIDAIVGEQPEPWWPKAIALHSSGDLIGAGELRDAPGDPASVRRIADDGHTVWDYRPGGASVRAIAVADDGSVYVLAELVDGIEVQKLSGDGEHAWTTVFPPGALPAGRYFQLVARSNDVILASDKSGAPLIQLTGDTGTPTQHPTPTSFSGDPGCAVIESIEPGLDDGFVVAGFGLLLEDGYCRFARAWVAAYDADLELRWEHSLPNDFGASQAKSVTTSTDGSVLVLGVDYEGASDVNWLVRLAG